VTRLETLLVHGIAAIWQALQGRFLVESASRVGRLINRRVDRRLNQNATRRSKGMTGQVKGNMGSRQENQRFRRYLPAIQARQTFADDLSELGQLLDSLFSPRGIQTAMPGAAAGFNLRLWR
jgi:hypothetical protein